MFKSIFSKLVFTYLIIIAVIIGVVSYAISFGYTNYVFKNKQQEQLKSAKKISRLVANYLEGISTKEELNSSINSIGYVTDSRIYVFKSTLKDLEKRNIDQLGEGLNENFLIEDLREVLRGQTVFHKKQYSTNLKMNVVFTGFPLYEKDKITGATLIFSPVEQINNEIEKINHIIWISALVIILISAVTIYFISRKISRPIIHMTSAVIKIAEGEQIEDVQVKSNDEIEKLASSFNIMKNQLAVTEKVRRDFIANVSHDLKTPLTSINGFVQGMIDGLIKPDNYPQYLSSIKQEINRLMKLTGNILEIAKIQGGAVKLNLSEVNIKELLDSAIEGVEIMAAEKEIKISSDCLETLVAEIDSDKIKQVLSNLLSNAVKYSDKKSEIWVSAISEEKNIEFQVRDNGQGISKEDAQYIFDKFYRGDKARQNDGGTGLGLNIAKELVELHGGKIWVESNVGEGTTICFTVNT